MPWSKLISQLGCEQYVILGSASCLLVAICPALSRYMQDHLSTDIIRMDPDSGSEFTGSGTIFKSTKFMNLVNLTTAATLLYSTGIGFTVAIGLRLVFL